MASPAELESLIGLFQDQRAVTHNLWTLYAVTTFTAAAFSFKNHAEIPLSLFVAVGYLAFAFGHLALVVQSIAATNALATAIEAVGSATVIKDGGNTSAFAKAAADIASTANPAWISGLAHLIIDTCVCILIIFGRGEKGVKGSEGS